MEGALAFKQYHRGCLSQASYLVGDRGTRSAARHQRVPGRRRRRGAAHRTGPGDPRPRRFPVRAPGTGGGDRGDDLLRIRGAGRVHDRSARPDLLGANGWSSDELARALFRSTRERLRPLPDATGVYPGHGAGSACGKNLSTETRSTVGEQRATNYALAPMTEDDFVAVVCEGRTSAPMYFAYVSHRNREERPLLDEATTVAGMSWDDVLAAQAAGAAVLDTRDAQDFAAGHLAGAVNVGLGGRFAEMTGEVLAADTDIVLVTDPGTAVEARNRLARIGFDRVIGHLEGGPAAIAPANLRTASRLTAAQLATVLATVQVVDVRGPGEVRVSGTLPGAARIPLPELVARIGELDPAAPTAVLCAGGYRSSIAASTLRASGFADVSDLLGGFGAWNDGRRVVTVIEPITAGSTTEGGTGPVG